MLRIRSQQLAVFSQAEARKFEEWTVAHLKRFFPKQCAATSETRLCEAIGYGIQRSATYGITAKSDVCRYIDLMIVFGRDFDTDKKLPWAGEILGSRNGPGVRIRTLQKAAQNHLLRG